MGLTLGWAVYLGGLVADLLDKTVTLLLVRTILVSAPARMAARFPGARRTIGEA
jgi:hypothetical protein